MSDLLEKHGANTAGRDFVVGDIHGCYDMLFAEMERVDFNHHSDRLFSVGDLIDRGPRSLDCLSLPFEPWFFGVRGNHEMMAYAALNGHSGLEHWFINGGRWLSQHDPREVRQILGEGMRYLPYAREVQVGDKRVGIVHAEPPSDWGRLYIGADDHLRQEMVWGRSRIKSEDATPVKGIDAVVVGHTILPEPTTLGNVHYIDTGAFHTDRLTLLELSEVTS